MEGVQPWNIQVKSRRAHSGEFEVYEASDHIMKVWEQHTSRDEADARLAVIFERDVKGEHLSSSLDGPNATLGRDLPEDSNLLQSLKTKCNRDGISDSEVEDLLASSTFAVTSWDEVTEETLGCLRAIEDLTTLPPSSLQHIALLLRVAIGDASNENASTSYGDRRVLRRTEIVGDIQRFATQIDLDSLEAAIREGVCEPLELGDAEMPDENRFYEGVATQPFHVASGLVVHRPDVTKQIKSGLGQKSTVVISGPSGVGKSAVLWTIPEEMPKVLWFRVRRLAPEDVSSIIRLARAYNASVQNPVGFLVDSAGTGEFAGWDRLRSEAGAIPGIHLVATARNEDLPLLGDMAECSTVEIRLDERTAEMIHRGLVERGATAASHWQEAFEDADGLTLEFTHLLTSGVRLRDLIDDQVNQRMVEKRHREINVLALVSTADRWSAEVSTSGIASACDLSDLEMREALDRLRAEHLVVERDGWIGGLHRLRSTAICDSIHDQPPPTLGQSLERVLPLIPTSQLHRFIGALLIDHPEARDIVLRAVNGDPSDIDRVAAGLQGLRLADFYERAKKWNEVATEHGIQIAARPALFLFAVGENQPTSSYAPDFRKAYRAIITTAVRDSREDLIDTIGQGRMAQLLLSTSDTTRATRFLVALAGIDSEYIAAVSGDLNRQSPLVLGLQEAPLEELAGCLAAVRNVDLDLARAVAEALGGETSLLERISADNPWITHLQIQDSDDGLVGSARFLHFSDELHEDPTKRAHCIGRTLLRCLPWIGSVDVQALLPGNQELACGDHVLGISSLKREYDHPETEAAWAQARMSIAIGDISESDTTRLQQALPLLNAASELAHDIGTAFVLGRQPPPDVIAQRISELHQGGMALPLPRQLGQVNDPTRSEKHKFELTGNLTELISSLGPFVFERLHQPNQYRALAAYIYDTTINDQIAKAALEPWHLIGVDGAPQSIKRLQTSLGHLATVVRELSYGQVTLAKLRESELSKTQHRALERVARASQRFSVRRQKSRVKEIESICHRLECQTKVFDFSDVNGLTEFRISIEVDSLFGWIDAVGQLADSLSHDHQPGETFLLVPIRRNRPVPMLTMRFTYNLWPEPQSGGLDKLSEAHPDLLAATFDKAQLALQTISGLCCLPEEQQDHQKVQAVADIANSELEVAYGRLCDMLEDPVVDWLRSMIEGLGMHVQAECEGTTTELGFAAQVALSLTTDEVTEYSALVWYAKCIALEWEIDPVAAADLLPEDDD